MNIISRFAQVFRSKPEPVWNDAPHPRIVELRSQIERARLRCDCKKVGQLRGKIREFTHARLRGE